MRIIRRLGLVMALVLPLLAGSASPASATTGSAGDLTFKGNAFLPRFPCPPPPPFGTGPCNGRFSGDWTGNLTGVAGTSPFDVAWSTSGTGVSALFVYAEWQCAADTETVLGIAQGTGSALAGPGQLQGKWQVVGEVFARDITGVRLTFSFTWTRLATGAAIVLSPVSLQVNVAGLGWQTVVSGSQEGVADFTPTSSRGTGVPSCANPLTLVNGTIAGSVPLASAA